MAGRSKKIFLPHPSANMDMFLHIQRVFFKQTRWIHEILGFAGQIESLRWPYAMHPWSKEYKLDTVKLGYNELGYNELGYNELGTQLVGFSLLKGTNLGYNEQNPVITKKITQIDHKLSFSKFFEKNVQSDSFTKQ